MLLLDLANESRVRGCGADDRVDTLVLLFEDASDKRPSTASTLPFWTDD
jgi:hypothetical protein